MISAPTARRRFWTRRRFWLTILLVPLVIAVSSLAVVGCVAGRIITPGDQTGLLRQAATTSLDGESVTISYLLTAEETSIEDDDRPWLLYVHGTPGDATNWGEYLRTPIEGTRAAALDRLGFGESARRTAYPSFEAQGQAVVAVLDAIDAQQAVLIGHSLGGPIVAQVAAMAPERTAAIVVIAGSLDPDLEKLAWYNHLLAFPLVGVFFPTSLNHSNDEVLAAREETTLLSERLAEVTCPVLIIHGTADSLVPFANVEYMQRMFVNAADVEVVALDGVDHFLIWSDEPIIRDALNRLLERQP